VSSASAAEENVGDLVMGGKEALNLPRRLEPLRDGIDAQSVRGELRCRCPSQRQDTSPLPARLEDEAARLVEESKTRSPSLISPLISICRHARR
jgi:hypothetical protein